MELCLCVCACVRARIYSIVMWCKFPSMFLAVTTFVFHLQEVSIKNETQYMYYHKYVSTSNIEYNHVQELAAKCQ